MCATVQAHPAALSAASDALAKLVEGVLGAPEVWSGERARRNGSVGAVLCLRGYISFGTSRASSSPAWPSSSLSPSNTLMLPTRHAVVRASSSSFTFKELGEIGEERVGEIPGRGRGCGQ